LLVGKGQVRCARTEGSFKWIGEGRMSIVQGLGLNVQVVFEFRVVGSEQY
jgi:hypothetical protein